MLMLFALMGHSTTHNAVSAKRKPDIFGGATHGKVGMWIFLVTDGFTFSGLLLGYGILRARIPEWPQPSQYLGIALASIMTFILICSSVSMVLAQLAGEQKDKKAFIKWLLVTICGGIFFLSAQVYEYNHLMHEMGMTFSNFLSGPPQFSSIFFITTGFHGFHVLSGVIYLCIILGRALAGKYDNGNINEVEIAGLFWHFVDLVWILVFTLMYLI
jgi:heme/copper-type cytochrome/quinol oxidase subunit 3